MNDVEILDELQKIKDDIEHLITKVTLSIVKVEKQKVKRGNGNDLCTIKARINRETPKALLLESGESEGWVAKSQIKNEYNPHLTTMFQEFTFPFWIKNKSFNKKKEVIF